MRNSHEGGEEAKANIDQKGGVCCRHGAKTKGKMCVMKDARRSMQRGKNKTSNEGCTNQCTKQVRMEEFAGHMDQL